MTTSCRALQGDKMPDQLPEELSPEKVPGALSKAPNINGAAPPRVRQSDCDQGGAKRDKKKSVKISKYSKGISITITSGTK